MKWSDINAFENLFCVGFFFLTQKNTYAYIVLYIMYIFYHFYYASKIERLHAHNIYIIKFSFKTFSFIYLYLCTTLLTCIFFHMNFPLIFFYFVRFFIFNLILGARLIQERIDKVKWKTLHCTLNNKLITLLILIHFILVI